VIYLWNITGRNVGSYTFADVPSGYIPQVNHNLMLAGGMTRAKAETIQADPKSSAAEIAMANEFIRQDNLAAGQKSQSTTAGNLKAKADAAALPSPTGPELSADGQKQMREASMVGSTFDDLIKKLEPYKNNNDPTMLMKALAKYKLGMASPEGELGNQLSSMSLASIQGMMPYASKSRSWQYIQEIQKHLPVIMGFPPDSPQMIYDKLEKSRRSFLRAERATMQWEQKKGGTNPAPPTLTPDRAQVYYQLAHGDPAKARTMAQDDGWALK
jgi:hypothetical protein